MINEELETLVAQQAAVIEQMREALAAAVDSDECQDADGWMCFELSAEAYHMAQEALALQPCPEVLNKVRAEAFTAGFMISGEGWNGEYPFGDMKQNPSEDKNFIACMNRYIEQEQCK